MASALASGARGRWFESSRPDHSVSQKTFVFDFAGISRAEQTGYELPKVEIFLISSKGITDPRMETLKKLAKALDVSIDELVKNGKV